MKRKLWMAVLTMMALFALVLGVTGCGKKDPQPKQLDPPSVSVNDEGLATWDGGPNAKSYVYQISGGAQVPTEGTSTTLEDGQEIRVKAIAKDGYLDSKFTDYVPYHAKTEDCEHTSYTLKGWSWTGNETKGYTAATATFKCDNCNDEQTATDNNPGSTETTAPKCLEDGVRTYTATVNFKGAPYSDTKTAAIPQYGSHDFTVPVAEKPATCEDDGYTAHKECSRCHTKNEEYEVTYALGHKYGEPTWKWEGSDTAGYTAATATFTCANDTEHKHTKEETVDVTRKEEEDGCTTKIVYTATVTVDLGNGNVTKTGKKTVTLTGAHTLDPLVPRVEPTCSSTGNLAYQKCGKCGAFFDEDGNEMDDVESEDDLILQIEPDNHVFDADAWHDEESASCTQAGTKAHQQCNECHKYFAKDGKTLVAENEAGLTIPTTPHAYTFKGTYADNPPTNDSTGSITVTCSNCPATKTVTLPNLSEGDYEIDGEDELSCDEGGDLLYTITVEGIEISFFMSVEAPGHKLADTIISKDEGHYKRCERCEEEVKVGDHTWTDDWADDNNNRTHSKTTTCSEHAAITDTADHDYDNGVCGTCDNHHDHGDGLEIEPIDDQHVYSCNVCHYWLEEAHSYEENSAFCKVCDEFNTKAESFKITFVAVDKKYSDKQVVTSVQEHGFSIIAFAKGSGTVNPAYYSTGSAVRVYGGGTITVKSIQNFDIIKITFTFDSGENSNAITVDVGSFSDTKWTGRAKTVTFSVASGSGHRRIQSIEIEYKAECKHTSLTKVDATTATCDKPAYNEYWTCDGCDNMYDGDNAATANKIDGPVANGKPLGHECAPDGTATKVDGAKHTGNCMRCGIEITEDHDEDNNGACSKCGYDPNALTPAQRAKNALEALKQAIIAAAGGDTKMILNEDFTVTSTDENVTFLIESNSDAIKYENGKLVVTRSPESDTTVQLTIRAQCGDHITPAGEEAIITLTVQQLPSGTITITAGTITNFAGSYARYQWTIGGVTGYVGAYKKDDSTMQFNSSKGNYVLNTTEMPAAITKITITGTTHPTNWHLATSSSAPATPTGATISEPSNKTAGTSNGAVWTLTGSDKFFVLYYNGSADYPTKIEITYGYPSGSGDTEHTCSKECPTCHKCLDATCPEDACKEKCQGHGSTGGDVWKLVTSSDAAIAVGDEIIIVGGNYAMSSSQGSNNRGAVSITINSNKTITTVSDSVAKIKITETDTGYFALYATNGSQGYLYPASSSSNYLKTQTSINDNAKWEISVNASGVATIKASKSQYSRNILKFNSGSTLFSCYSSGQADVYIYRHTTT